MLRVAEEEGGGMYDEGRVGEGGGERIKKRQATDSAAYEKLLHASFVLRAEVGAPEGRWSTSNLRETPS